MNYGHPGSEVFPVLRPWPSAWNERPLALSESGPQQLWGEASGLRVLALSLSFCLSDDQSLPPSWQPAETGERDETQIHCFTTWDCLDLFSAPWPLLQLRIHSIASFPRFPFSFSQAFPFDAQFFHCPLPDSTCSPDTHVDIQFTRLPDWCAHFRSKVTRWHITFCTFLLANFCVLGTTVPRDVKVLGS